MKLKAKIELIYESFTERLRPLSSAALTFS